MYQMITNVTKRQIVIYKYILYIYIFYIVHTVVAKMDDSCTRPMTVFLNDAWKGYGIVLNLKG